MQLFVQTSFMIYAFFNDPFEKLQPRILKGNAVCVENIDAPPLLIIHLNKSPMVATPGLIDSQIAKRLNINLDK